MGRPDATAAERQTLSTLETKFRENNVDVGLLGAEGALHLWLAQARGNGQSQEAALASLRTLVSDAALDALWDDIEGVLAFGKSWTASLMDAKLLTELGLDLKRGGSFLTRYRIATYGGKQYIIFKGAHKARQALTGTRYLAANTKVVNMGIGKLGAAKSIKGGMFITLFLTVGFRALEQLLNDEATWHDFVGGLAGDVVKIGIAGGASMIAACLAGAGATAGAIAVGPLFAAIAVGVVVGLALDYVDEQIGFTQGLINGLREAEQNLLESMSELKRQYNWYTRNPFAEYQFWMRVFGASY